MKRLTAWYYSRKGLTTIEYVLLLALVAIAAITAWTTLGSDVAREAAKAAS